MDFSLVAKIFTLGNFFNQHDQVVIKLNPAKMWRTVLDLIKKQSFGFYGHICIVGG